MKKSINIVLIGVLTVASIILALPFTPLRNSFKGVTSNAADKALASMGVDLKGKIMNARQISAAHQYEASNMNLGLIVDSKGRVVNANNYGSVGFSSDGYNLNNSANTEKTTNANGVNSSFSGSGKSSSKSNQSAGGFVSISTQLSNNTGKALGGSTKQSGNAQNNGTGGGTHPGVDPTPSGGGALPSLPIGNGTLFLLALAAVFGTMKARKLLA